MRGLNEPIRTMLADCVSGWILIHWSPPLLENLGAGLNRVNDCGSDKSQKTAGIWVVVFSAQRKAGRFTARVFKRFETLSTTCLLRPSQKSRR